MPFDEPQTVPVGSRPGPRLHDRLRSVERHRWASQQWRPATTTRRLATQAIETIRFGQRVVGVNPLTHETQPASVVGPQTHRAVRLTPRQHGLLYAIGLLRSLDWLQSAGAATGGTIVLSQTEMGVEGPAAVVSIAPCPPLEPDDGTGRMLVTGRFKHLAANVLDVSITGEERPLGVTDTHPIRSADRQRFVVAGQLRDGERLRSLTGHVTQVTRITPTRGPPQHVYNLEVDAQHLCHVTSTSLLAHNTCEKITLCHGMSRSSHATLNSPLKKPILGQVPCRRGGW